MTQTAFATTLVGSMPKPDWLIDKTADRSLGSKGMGAGIAWSLAGTELRGAQDDVTELCILRQARAGLDRIVDGELRRAHYISDVTRRLAGFDYTTLAPKAIRGGRTTIEVGRCVGRVRRTEPILAADADFLRRHAPAGTATKITLPGPMTVVDTTYDATYGDERAMARDVAAALNAEAKALAEAGVAIVQFDEPVFSRRPEATLDWGVAALDEAAAGVAAEIAVHVCYGYPIHDAERLIPDTYPTILERLNATRVAYLSLEFEASGVDPAVLRHCPDKTVLFGCVDVGHADGRVESPEHVRDRLLAAAEHLPPEQIEAAPDCGLVKLDEATAWSKIRSLVAGAEQARAAHAGHRVPSSGER